MFHQAVWRGRSNSHSLRECCLLKVPHFLRWGVGTDRGSFSLLCSSALVRQSLGGVWSQHWLNLGGFKNTKFFTDNWEWPHYWGHQAFYRPLGSHMEQCQSQGELPMDSLCAWKLSHETLTHMVRTGVKLSVVPWTPHFPLQLHCSAPGRDKSQELSEGEALKHLRAMHNYKNWIL